MRQCQRGDIVGLPVPDDWPATRSAPLGVAWSTERGRVLVYRLERHPGVRRAGDLEIRRTGDIVLDALIGDRVVRTARPATHAAPLLRLVGTLPAGLVEQLARAIWRADSDAAVEARWRAERDALRRRLDGERSVNVRK
jgi:hypothetical protein